MNQEFPNIANNQDIDFKRILRLILGHWWLIVLCLAIGLAAANLYIRYTEPIYSSSGSIIIKDEESSSLGADAAKLDGFDKFQTKKNLSTEMEIIKSNPVVQHAVGLMDFVGVSYFAKGRFKTTELYKDTPFIVEADTFYAQEQTFNIRSADTARFRFSYLRGEEEISTQHRFNEKITNQFGVFTLRKNLARPTSLAPDVVYSFIVHHPWSMVGKFRGSTGVGRANEETPMLILSCSDNVPERAMDFVNALIRAYQEIGRAHV